MISSSSRKGKGQISELLSNGGRDFFDFVGGSKGVMISGFLRKMDWRQRFGSWAVLVFQTRNRIRIQR